MSNNGKIIYLSDDILERYPSEKTMFFPLKESEATMLLAFVPYIQWETRWKNTQLTQAQRDEISANIAHALMNPVECTGDEDMATPEEIQNAVCEGILCATPRIGQALAGAINSGVAVTVDGNGNIVIDDGSSGDTGLSGSLTEFKWGASLEVHDGLQEYITDFEDFFNDFPANEAQVVSFLSQKWQVNAGITQAVSDYFDHRNLMNPAPQPLPDELVGEFFCYGATKQTTASYMIDNVSNDLLLLLTMLDALMQEQYDAWWTVGYEVPRLGYDVAPCYRVPAETVTVKYSELLVNSWDNILFSGKPDGHRWRVSVKCVELFTNANGDTFDGVYATPNGGSPGIYTHKLFETYSTQITLRENYGGQLPLGGIYNSEWGTPSPYQPKGYRWDLPFSNFTQGEIEMTLTDLGVFTV